MDNIEKIVQYLSWVTTIIFAVVLIYNILRGFLRGFRKSMILFILSIASLIAAYLIYLFVLRKPFFDQLIMDIIEKVSGKPIEDSMKLSEKPTTLSECVSLFIKSKMSEKNQLQYGYFDEVVVALTTSILGILYMSITFVVWFFIYKLTYFVIYLPFLREGKYKKKVEKRYQETSSDEDAEDDLVEKKPKIKHYKRRRGLGCLVGAVKGVLMGVIFTSIYVTLFYITSNGKTYKIEDDEQVVISYNGKETDLTEFFDAVYEYDRTGMNFVLNRFIKIDGYPLGAYIPSLFCNGKIVIKEDNINTKIYPIKELSNMVGIIEEGIMLLNDYNVFGSSSDETTLNILKAQISNNDEFVDALYDYIASIPSKTPLFKTLGKIVSNHFYDMLENAGYANKYLECIFRGDHAITISDIVSKSDIKVCLNIVSTGIKVYDDYKESNDFKQILINQTEAVKSVTNEVLNLHVFENDSDTVNGLVGDLLEIVCERIDTLKGISFDGIKFVGKSNILSEFTSTVFKFLNISLIEYSDNNLSFNYKNINSIFNANEGETSVIDDIKSSEVLRRISSCILTNSNIDGAKLYIPTSCKDDSGYISKEEFTNFFTSIQKVIESSTFSKDSVYLSDLVEDIVPEIVSTISNNKDMPSYVTSSKVLSAIASNYIYDGIKDTVVVPDELVLTDEVRDEHIDAWLGEDGELNHLLNAAIAYNVGDIITNGAEIDIDSFLDSSKMETALKSEIIYYTVSNEIIKAQESNDQISIPKSAYDGELISKSEIVNTIAAVEELEKNLETKDLDSLDQNVILTADINVDTILKSNIIWYSISKSFVDSGVNIPNAAYVDTTSEEKFITKDEISNTVDALKNLSQTNLDEIEINSNVFLTLVAEDSKMNAILNSYTAWYEISSRFITCINEIPADVKTNILDQTYITKDEIINTTKALNEFDITQIETYSISQEKLLSITSYDKILASHIIWFKATKEMIDSNGFIILKSAIDETMGDVYMQYNEIYNLLTVCSKLGATTFEMESFSLSKVKEYGLETTISNTITLRATLTDIVLYQNHNGIIYDEDHVTSNNEVYNSNTTRYVYTALETKNIISGLNALGIDTYNAELDYSISEVKSLNEEDRDILLSSNTLYLYTSDLFKTYVPYEANPSYYTNGKVLTGTVVIDDDYKVLIKDKIKELSKA